MTKVRNLNMISDPGHGWLSISMKDLVELDIVDQISNCSRFNKGRVYLEEDCDAFVYLKAARAAGWEVKINDKYQEKTPLRSYPSYTKENIKKSNNLITGGIFYMFNPQNRKCDNRTVITNIVKTKYYIEDSEGFRYKTSANYLIKNTTLNKEVERK